MASTSTTPAEPYVCAACRALTREAEAVPGKPPERRYACVGGESSCGGPLLPGLRKRPKGTSRCENCRHDKKLCQLVPPSLSSACYRCHRLGKECSVGFIVAASRSSSSQVDVSPSGPTSDLNKFVLTLALRYHLLQTYTHYAGRSAKLGVGGMLAMELSLRRTSDDVTCMSQEEEVLSLAICLQAASISTHSHIIGSTETRLPTFDVLPTESDWSQFSWMSSARRTPMMVIAAHLKSKVEALVASATGCDCATCGALYSAMLSLNEEDNVGLYEAVKDFVLQRVGKSYPQDELWRLQSLQHQYMLTALHLGLDCTVPTTLLPKLPAPNLPPSQNFLLPRATVDDIVLRSRTMSDVQQHYKDHFLLSTSRVLQDALRLFTYHFSPPNDDAVRAVLQQLAPLVTHLEESIRRIATHAGFLEHTRERRGGGPHRLLVIIVEAISQLAGVLSPVYRHAELEVDGLHPCFTLLATASSFLFSLRHYFDPWELHEYFIDSFPYAFWRVRGAHLTEWVEKHPEEAKNMLPALDFASYSSAQAGRLANLMRDILREISSSSGAVMVALPLTVGPGVQATYTKVPEARLISVDALQSAAQMIHQ